MVNEPSVFEPLNFYCIYDDRDFSVNEESFIDIFTVIKGNSLMFNISDNTTTKQDVYLRKDMAGV